MLLKEGCVGGGVTLVLFVVKAYSHSIQVVNFFLTLSVSCFLHSKIKLIGLHWKHSRFYRKCDRSGNHQSFSDDGAERPHVAKWGGNHFLHE